MSLYTFGALKPSTANLPFTLGFPVGDTRNNKDVYDDAILRAARTRSAGQPSARRATNRSPLSFGSSVPQMASVPLTTNLDFGDNVPTRSGNPLFPTSSGDFLRLASFGRSLDDTRVSSPGTYDDAILRTARQVQNIPKVHTAKIDGGSGTLDSLRNAAQGILSSLGSTGDGEIVPVAFGGGEEGGINPLWIAGAAVAAGLIYYTVAK